MIRLCQNIDQRVTAGLHSLAYRPADVEQRAQLRGLLIMFIVGVFAFATYAGAHSTIQIDFFNR